MFICHFSTLLLISPLSLIPGTLFALMLLSSLFSLIFPSLKSFPLFFLSPFQFLSLFPLFLPLPSFLSSHLSISLSLSHLLLFLIPVTSVLLVVSVFSCLSLNPFFLVVLFCRSLSDLFLFIPSLFSLFRFLNVPSPTHLIPFSLLSSNAPPICPLSIHLSLCFSSPSLPLLPYLSLTTCSDPVLSPPEELLYGVNR